jgi:hypothetical protein
MYFTLNIQTQQTLFERVAKRSHYNARLECLLMYYFMKENVNKRKKLKSTLVQALRLCTGRTAHRGSRGTAPLFRDQRY